MCASQGKSRSGGDGRGEYRGGSARKGERVRVLLGGVVYGYVVVEASIAEWEGSYGSSVVLREMSWDGGRWYVMEGILWIAVSGVFNI